MGSARRLGDSAESLRNLRGKKKKGSRKQASKSDKKKASADASEKVRVAIVDFPEGGNFPILGDDGRIVGSLVTDALDDIVLDIEGLRLSEVQEVTMIYSHPHFDHIAAGAITYNHLMTEWGLGEDAIGIVAVKGAAEDFDQKIALGRFSFRSPLPTSVVVEETTMMLGTTQIEVARRSGDWKTRNQQSGTFTCGPSMQQSSGINSAELNYEPFSGTPHCRPNPRGQGSGTATSSRCFTCKVLVAESE